MTTSQSLRLNPWKDGFVETIKQVEQIYARVNAKTVYFVFNEEDFFEYLYEIDAIALFEAVGSKLVKLESVVIQVNVSSKLPAMSIPPIQGLTSLLVAQKKIKYLTMLGLQLEGSDLDINGLIEAIRIHPTLHSVVIKDCAFSSKSHVNRLRKTINSREGMKHCDLLNNFSVDRRISWKLGFKWKNIFHLLLYSLLVLISLDVSTEKVLAYFPNMNGIFFNVLDQFKVLSGIIEEDQSKRKTYKEEKGKRRR